CGWRPRRRGRGGSGRSPPRPRLRRGPRSARPWPAARSLEEVRSGGPELVGEHAPDLAVVGRRALAGEVGAHRPLVHPTEAGHGLLGDLVAGGDAAVDAMGAVLVEGPGDRQRLGPAADALAAHVVAD